MTDPVSRLRELEQAATVEPWRIEKPTKTGGRWLVVGKDAEAVIYYTNDDDGLHETDPGNLELLMRLRNSAKEIIELVEAVGEFRKASYANVTGLLTAGPAAELINAKEDAFLRLHGAYDSLIAKLGSQ